MEATPGDVPLLVSGRGDPGVPEPSPCIGIDDELAEYPGDPLLDAVPPWRHGQRIDHRLTERLAQAPRDLVPQ